MKNVCCLILPVFILLYSVAAVASADAEKGKWTRNVKISAELNGEKFEATYSVYIPSKRSSDSVTVLLLHDYNGSSNDWIRESVFTREAEKRNYVLIAPDMKMSAYENEFYPETKVKWSPVPGAKWIGEFLIPHAKSNFGAFSSREKTMIAGAGMGGRGAFICAARYPKYFKYVAGFSGYYDNETLKRNSALNNLFGSYKENPERWKTCDSPLVLADNLSNMILFLSHGIEDYIVSPDQSVMFGVKLNSVKKKNSNVDFRYYTNKYGMHDWNMFNSGTAAFLSFVDEKR